MQLSVNRQSGAGKNLSRHVHLLECRRLHIAQPIGQLQLFPFELAHFVKRQQLHLLNAGVRRQKRRQLLQPLAFQRVSRQQHMPDPQRLVQFFPQRQCAQRAGVVLPGDFAT